MTKQHFLHRNGTLQKLQEQAEHIDDILYIKEKIIPSSITIGCRPDYDIDTVKEFINNNLPDGIDYHIIAEVENNSLNDMTCETCYYCMGRSLMDCICEKTRMIHQKTYTCNDWR